MAEKRVTFENVRGEELSARLERPPDDEPIAYALFAHCFTCSKDLKAMRRISRALCLRGIAVLRFDFTGLGESEGDFAESTFSSDVKDVVAAARFLEEAYEGPKILVGHSLGGAAVLCAAQSVESARAVATIGAPFDPAHVEHLLEEAKEEIEAEGEATVTIAGRSFTVHKAFLDDLQGHNMRAALQNLERALLVFHGPLDNVVGIDNATKIFEAAKHPKSFVSLDEADHLLSKEADAIYVGEVLAAWAGKYIGAPQQKRKEGAPNDNRIVARTGAGSFRTDILANGHALVSDEPESVGGTNEGPTPYDLLVAALGACTSMTLRMYAEHKGWPLEEAVVRLRHEKIHAEDCAHCETEEGKIDRIEREVQALGPLTEKQRERLVEIANKCPVHRTLTGEIDIPTFLKTAGRRPETTDE